MTMQFGPSPCPASSNLPTMVSTCLRRSLYLSYSCSVIKRVFYWVAEFTMSLHCWDKDSAREFRERRRDKGLDEDLEEHRSPSLKTTANSTTMSNAFYISTDIFINLDVKSSHQGHSMLQASAASNSPSTNQRNTSQWLFANILD